MWNEKRKIWRVDTSGREIAGGSTEVNITWINREPAPYYSDIKDKPFAGTGVIYKGIWHWSSVACVDMLREYGENRLDEIEEGVDVTAWMPLPEPYREAKE